MATNFTPPTRPPCACPWKRFAVTACLLLCALWPAEALGQGQHSRHDLHTASGSPRDERQPGDQSPGEPGVFKTPLARLKIPDADMLDQEGKRVRLYSDLIKGKVVVLNFFFTRCANVCRWQGVALKNLQARLGERIGREVFFISISKDSKNDTPARLKRWGVQFGVGHGWTLLTGDAVVIDSLSMGMTFEEANSPMHSPILLIGNDKTGVWAQASGEATTDEIMTVVERIVGSAGAPRR